MRTQLRRAFTPIEL